VASTLAVPVLVIFCLVAYCLLAILTKASLNGLFGKPEKHWRYGGIRSGLAVLNLVYMPITVGMLMVLPCRESADGKSYLWAAPWIECTSSSATWIRLVVIGALFSVLYGLGVPLVFLVLMRNRKSQLKRLKALKIAEVDGHWFQWFYAAYHDSCHWFEFAIMARRLAIAIIAIVPATSLAVPMGFFITIVAAMLVQIYTEPFIFPTLNKLELITLVQLLFTFVAGQVFSSRIHERDLASSSGVLEVLVIGTNAVVVGLYIFVIARELHNRRGRLTGSPDAKLISVNPGVGTGHKERADPTPRTISAPHTPITRPVVLSGIANREYTYSYEYSEGYIDDEEQEEADAACDLFLSSSSITPPPASLTTTPSITRDALVADLRSLIDASNVAPSERHAVLASVLATWHAPR